MWLNTSIAWSRGNRANALVVMLGFLWGWNWIATKIALAELTPWDVRIFGLSLATLTLLVAAKSRGTSLAIPAGRPRLHIVVAALLNVAGFNMFSAFAQLGSTTSRVVIIAYTMPVWAVLIARVVLGERLSTLRVLALAFCVAGLAILIWPLMSRGIPDNLAYAFIAAWLWAAGTVYLKWARIAAKPLAIAVWQLGIGAICILACAFVFGGMPAVLPRHIPSFLALAYSGFIGLGLAYLLWFDVITRLPAATASLGVLMVPVVGVVFSALLLGERPPPTDIFGFALIFAGATSALLQPDSPAHQPFKSLRAEISRRFGDAKKANP